MLNANISLYMYLAVLNYLSLNKCVFHWQYIQRAKTSTTCFLKSHLAVKARALRILGINV